MLGFYQNVNYKSKKCYNFCFLRYLPYREFDSFNETLVTNIHIINKHN